MRAMKLQDAPTGATNANYLTPVFYPGPGAYQHRPPVPVGVADVQFSCVVIVARVSPGGSLYCTVMSVPEACITEMFPETEEPAVTAIQGVAIEVKETVSSDLLIKILATAMKPDLAAGVFP